MLAVLICEDLSVPEAGVSYMFHCLFVQVPMVLCIKVGTKPQAKWLQ